VNQVESEHNMSNVNLVNNVAAYKAVKTFRAFSDLAEGIMHDHRYAAETSYSLSALDSVANSAMDCFFRLEANIQFLPKNGQTPARLLVDDLRNQTIRTIGIYKKMSSHTNFPPKTA
jgi:hypothetical protein